MHVRVLTPEGEVIATPALSVSLVTELGAIQIFPGHASLQGTISFSPLRIEIDGQSAEDFVLQRGFIYIDQDKDEVTIQAYQCQKHHELSYASIKEYLDILMRSLSNPEALGSYHLRHLEDERLATQKRLEVIQQEDKK